MEHSTQFRVRYSEIDKMGTFYNSRALEWFEHGRTEPTRAMGIPYADMEPKGFGLPLVEAHLEFLGRAGYDDLLTMTTSMAMVGKARVRFDMMIVHASPESAVAPRPVCRGYTVHAVTDAAGRPTRPPEWFVKAVEPATR